MTPQLTRLDLTSARPKPTVQTPLREPQEGIGSFSRHRRIVGNILQHTAALRDAKEIHRRVEIASGQLETRRLHRTAVLWTGWYRAIKALLAGVRVERRGIEEEGKRGDEGNRWGDGKRWGIGKRREKRNKLGECKGKEE